MTDVNHASSAPQLTRSAASAGMADRVMHVADEFLALMRQHRGQPADVGAARTIDAGLRPIASPHQ